MEEIRKIAIDLILTLAVLYITVAPLLVLFLLRRRIDTMENLVKTNAVDEIKYRAQFKIDLVNYFVSKFKEYESEHKLVDKKPETLSNEFITKTVRQPEPSQNEQELIELKQLRDQIKSGNYETYADHPDLSALGPLDAWRRTIELIEEKERNQMEAPTL